MIILSRLLEMPQSRRADRAKDRAATGTPAPGNVCTVLVSCKSTRTLIFGLPELLYFTDSDILIYFCIFLGCIIRSNPSTLSPSVWRNGKLHSEA